ncbi:hypothetical protein SAMN04515617_102198 [Collimonas sp. OK242]|jgi:hypothetical protein|nr:hypothetical protein SAMN04515617_102198 [Collimonas sp. OK242]
MSIDILGIDLAKRVFQLSALLKTEAAKSRKQTNRHAMSICQRQRY